MSPKSSIVLGKGRAPNVAMFVGEAPGKKEQLRGIPFVGFSGKMQQFLLARNGLHMRSFYLTNVVKEYREGNPDPTDEQIKEWTPLLMSEIRKVRPKVIVAVGRFAARWFLGNVKLEMVHGMPHFPGAFDTKLRPRARGAIIIPVYHPAGGLYDNTSMSKIFWDYARASELIHTAMKGGDVNIRTDDVECEYLDAGAWDIKEALDSAQIIGLDTEGYPIAPWSIQISHKTGRGLVLRCSSPDFQSGVEYLQEAVDRGVKVVIHNSMFDIEMCRIMGLDLSNANMFDSMCAAYLLRLEPQGLKFLARRWCGMDMNSYSEVTSPYSAKKQLDYLLTVSGVDWDKPEPRIINQNDGTIKFYKPQSINKRVDKILVDFYSGKVNSKGEGVDVLARWNSIDQELRSPVESLMGPIPLASLDDVPLDEAIYYSARDADATLRLYKAILPELSRMDLLRTMNDCMKVLPVFEEMQHNGMPASRPHLERLSNDMWEKMSQIQTHLSFKYYNKQPFNPASPIHVRALLRMRLLEGSKKTATGAVSTGKKSIEHLRYIDEAIDLVFRWRECQHIRDSFCSPLLDRIPEGEEIYPVRCEIKTTRTATRRLAAARPNLLNIPIRSKAGKRVRDSFICSEGELFGAWDLSQIEMRVMAHESRDEMLCKLFAEGRDIHTETAAKIFGVDIRDVDQKKHRLPAKNAGFGIIYGIQGPGLLTQLRMLGLDDWTEKSCASLISEWLKVYKGVNSFIKATIKEAEELGFVRDCWGMYRYVPAIWSENRKDASEAGRFAVSHKIQGGAQGMIQKSMIWLKPKVRKLQKSGLNVKWCLQIHDEVILRFSEDLWSTIDQLVREGLTQHCGIELIVPVEAEGTKGRSWGDLK